MSSRSPTAGSRASASRPPLRPSDVTLEERVSASLAALGIDRDDRIAVACSGGADSIALVHLLVQRTPKPTVFHVDHGLRDGSCDDAMFVQQTATALGLDCAQRSVR